MGNQSKDLRTLEQKLRDLSVDKGATPAERKVARLKLSLVLLHKHEREKEVQKDKDFAAKHGFTVRQAYDPDLDRSAGWQSRNRHESDDGPTKKRDYKSPPRFQRGVNREAWINLTKEAAGRAKYNKDYWSSLFGIDDAQAAARNRIRLGDAALSILLGPVDLKDHICLINGKITKRLLFWSHVNYLEHYWFIVQRDTVTGKTQRSKRYFSREAALQAHKLEQITWQKVEYT